ncbi:MAG: hypothetical protein QM723_22545 [Myxococcaceae bacterium]
MAKARCRYVVVGGQALAAAGKPRFTQDLDILVEPGAANAARVADALTAFGFAQVARAVRTQFRDEKRMATLGVPPVAIDIMTSISGVTFEEAWNGRLELKLGRLQVPFLGATQLLKNKVASGRDKDLIDAANLEELMKHSPKRPARRKRRAK